MAVNLGLQDQALRPELGQQTSRSPGGWKSRSRPPAEVPLLWLDGYPTTPPRVLMGLSLHVCLCPNLLSDKQIGSGHPRDLCLKLSPPLERPYFQTQSMPEILGVQDVNI